jgi:hypothetical protein
VCGDIEFSPSAFRSAAQRSCVGKLCDEEQEVTTESARTRRLRDDGAVAFTEVVVN